MADRERNFRRIGGGVVFAAVWMVSAAAFAAVAYAVGLRGATVSDPDSEARLGSERGAWRRAPSLTVAQLVPTVMSTLPTAPLSTAACASAASSRR
jgi:hypothetical protein